MSLCCFHQGYSFLCSELSLCNRKQMLYVWSQREETKNGPQLRHLHIQCLPNQERKIDGSAAAYDATNMEQAQLKNYKVNNGSYETAFPIDTTI